MPHCKTAFFSPIVALSSPEPTKQHSRSGLTVIATASETNFPLVKSYGASAAFDYRDPDCGRQIRDFTNNSLRHVLDCVSVEPSFRIDAAALSRDAGPEQLHCLALLPPDGWPAERKDVNVR